MQNQPHRRYNPLLNEWVKVSPQRTQRPWQGKSSAPATSTARPHDPDCYLCAGNRRSNGTQNPHYIGPFVFDNDFPALLPPQNPKVMPASIPSPSPLIQSTTNNGLCRVLCFSPRHDATLADLSINELKAVIAAWQNQITELAKQPWIRHVQIFENRGAEMGCSNPHPHCQIWADDHIPDLPAREIHNQTTWFANAQSILLLEYVKLEMQQELRLVYHNQDFAVIVPYWAVWPFETIVLPRFAINDLRQLNTDQMENLALALQAIVGAYDRLFDCQFPYSMGLHQAPVNTPYPEGLQLHWHFYPPLLRSATVRKYMVGYELLAMAQRDIQPEDAAERLRQALSKVPTLAQNTASALQ